MGIVFGPVLDKTRELGMLRTLGSTRDMIARSVILEAMLPGALGSLVQGSDAGGSEIGFYYPQLPALAALLSGLFIGVFAGLLPARSAARKSIVEAV
jgi:putative ABC transport system permease protein